MSRHLRRIGRMDTGRATRASEQWKFNQHLRWIVDAEIRASEISNSRFASLLSIPEPATVTNLDADHAVAIERNRCLAIIDEHLAKLDRAHMPAEAFRVAILREQIAGHDPSASPASQEQG